MFKTVLTSFIHPEHELCLLAKKIDGKVSRKNLLLCMVKLVEVRVDTTVQEKNITFPTDRKLIDKVIEHSKRIPKKEDIKLKLTFGREIKKLSTSYYLPASRKT